MSDQLPSSLSIDDDAADYGDAEPPIERWQLLGSLCVLFSFVALVAAGSVLSASDLGRATALPGCDASILAGAVLLLVAGALLGAARIIVDCGVLHTLHFDSTRLAVLLPVPLAASILALPNFLGCRSVASLEGWGPLGDALLGTPGLVVAGAALFMLGLVPTFALRVRDPLSVMLARDHVARHGTAGLNPVDRALAAHDLLAAGATLDADHPLERLDRDDDAREGTDTPPV